MRRILPLCWVVVLSAGCGSTELLAVKRVPPCRSVVTWHQRLYYPREVAALPVTGENLGPGGVPSCKDALGGENGASRAVDIVRIGGIDPSVAIAVFGDGHHAYVAAGRSLRLPGAGSTGP
jgi:uncharacterized protein DUF6281